MSSRLRRPPKPTRFAILMVGAAALALLTPRWTGCPNSLTQPLGWFQWAVSSGTRQARGTFENLSGAAPTREELDQLRRQNRRLAEQVGQQQVLINELERVVTDLSDLRGQLGVLQAKILFASVVGGDTSPRRETITISRGRRHGVERGDWVAAGLSPAERDSEATGQDLLLRQWVIGRVSEVQPYLSRVQLTTDPHFGPERAWVAKPLADGTWQVAERQCGLEGLGNGRMRIDQASEDYLASGQTIVLLPLAHPRPMALAVGRIVASKPLETGLHYELEVEPWGAPYTLAHVYVLSLSP